MISTVACCHGAKLCAHAARDFRSQQSLVKSQRNCFNCLGRGHMSRECKSHNRCATCNKSHHSLLHNDNSSKSSCSKTPSDLESGATMQSSSAQVNYVSPITVPSQIKMVRLMVAPVRVYSNDQTHFVDTYAFLDGGSNISLWTTTLTQRLKLRGSKVMRKSEGVTGSKFQQGFVVAMKLKGLKETELISMPSVLAIKELRNFNASIHQ